MNVLKKINCLTIMLVLSLIVQAQNDKKVEMADTMRSNGRIYVVLAVILTILAGLILYITRLEKKINKLEKEN